MSITNPVEPVLHKVRVRLSPSNLPRDKGAFIARTNSEKMITVDDVCMSLKARGGFEGNYNMLIHNVREFLGEMAYLLADGYAVNMEFFSIHPRAGGLFRNKHESAAGRKVKFSFVPREPMQRLGEAITIGVVDSSVTRAVINRFVDVGSGAENVTLEPGSLFALHGYKIKVKGDNPKCGVYFVSTHDNKSYKVKRVYATNTCSRIVSVVPPLPPGEYRIVIKTQFTIGGKDLKSPRTIESGFTLRCLG
ncbi:MAG: DUF4469 domain-containing protein [Treponema sp.]|nr:DUF4469 domain-containing protein [Treponema sp.]